MRLVGVVSPPYSNRLADNDERKYMDSEGRFKRPETAYGGDSQNIGNLKDGVVGVTSPPYEAQSGGIGKASRVHTPDMALVSRHLGGARGGMGKSEGNLGNENGQTYLSAMLQVYGEAFKSGISPLVVITKNPTRKGKLRRLDLDTLKLLEQVGYKIIDYHRAVLFKVKEENQATLDGEKLSKQQIKGRVSFFKRLSLAKGNVAAQWEDILIAVIPNKTGLAGAVSPPYSSMAQGDPEKQIDGWKKLAADPNSNRYNRKSHPTIASSYSDNPSNIGNLRDV